jgi:thiol-disulfide isomerase/thioredoxin
MFSLAYVLFFTKAGGTNTNTSQQTTDSNSAVESEPASTSTENTGVFKDYSQETLASAEGDVYLFFHAPWCPQCRAIETDIEKQGVPKGVTILKVDYDTNQDLRKKYGVTLQTTFVKLDSNGNKISNYVAYNEPTFSAVKRDFIN